MPGTLDIHEFADGRSSEDVRTVRVWTPRQYATERRRALPVLYLQDGQNVFADADSATGVAWKAQRTAQTLIDAGRIPPIILVGVDNQGRQRTSDYTRVEWKGDGGAADDYAALLVDEIRPFVDGAYRTARTPESTGIGGSSLGGLFALYAGLQRPEVFGNVMAMSPSVFWGDDDILDVVEQAPRSSVRIWADAGRLETQAMRRGLRKLSRTLQANGWQPHRVRRRATFRATEDPRGRHDEASWGRRFGKALQFLFGAKPVPGRPSRPPSPPIA